MARRLFGRIRRGDGRKQHSPVVCLLCGPTIRDRLTVLSPCNHVYCVPCWEDYTNRPQILTDGVTRSKPRIYCPTCLQPCENTKISSKLPDGLAALLSHVKKVERRGCKLHGGCRDIVGTCATCMKVCCRSCLGEDTHERHDVLSGTPDTWRLDELVKCVNEKETLAAQALRLREEHRKAFESTANVIRSDTRQKIDKLRKHEAAQLADLENRRETMSKNIDMLHKLASNTAKEIRNNIGYLHKLLQDQTDRRDELLVNQPALQVRTQTLLQSTTPDGTYFTEPVYIKDVTSFPEYKPGPLGQLGTLEETQRELPSVQHTDLSLGSLTGEEDSPEHVEPTRKHPSKCYRTRERPQVLKELYDPIRCNVEPAAAIFLPDDRLVITERKGHKLSIYKNDYSILDCNIVPSPESHPYAVTYCPKNNLIWYTDKRNFTIGYVAPTGENDVHLRHEILRNPEGIGVLESGHIIVSDNNLIKEERRPKGVKILDPHNSQSVHLFHIEPEGSPSWITVLQDGRVAVTDKGTGHVHLYDARCQQKITSIVLEEPEQMIEDGKGDLLIATAKKSSVLLYDGRQLQRRQEVLSLQNGGLMSPSAIALNPYGELAVVQRTGSVKVYGLYDCE